MALEFEDVSGGDAACLGCARRKMSLRESQSSEMLME